MTISKQPHGWKKSSYSENESCVELDSTLTRVRDSKYRNGPILNNLILGPFINAAKRGEVS